MALSFIGKPISLISHSDVRYRGILAGIDPAASTIQLSNVYSMGTETRRPPEEFIPPVQDPYQYIIFRASEVKDLAVEEPVAPAPMRNVHDDPAVLNAGASNGYAPYGGGAPGFQQGPPAGPGAHGSGSISTAAASLETVERALGDLRVSNARGGGGRRGGRDLKAGDLRVPATDFDFAGSNARFDKTVVASSSKSPKAKDGAQTPGSEGGKEGEGKEAGEVDEAEEEDKAYNPTKSFFDSLSSSTQGLGPAPRGGGRGGRGGGRNRREEERERNVATFGEPGGVGLMGPGAYVGGWGGYGRRGGGRGRRNPPAQQAGGR
ncbi:hypothetical protein BV25DRAFT_244014 [Artomyces pyxidatus]|uniref:Uncharacterized protein n=1 Tax=Artomyces pyxidatus TaxID=48021 RepID=A0ACB8T6X9_9AGAM|nr:hypothetical protein BV25DRAFT_244014 [Artomyces pyxidatus]